jgi:hypothetical protein
MPVTRLRLFAFLQQHLSQFPFRCQRLALVQPGEAGGPVSQEHDTQSWEEMRAQLNEFLAGEETYRAFLAYLVDRQRARTVESPAYHPSGTE